MKYIRLLVVLFAILLAILACGGPAATPAPTPTPNVVAKGTDVMQPVTNTGPTYSTSQLYDNAKEIAAREITNRVTTNAWVFAIAAFLMIVVICWWVEAGRSAWPILLAIALLVSTGIYIHTMGQIPGKVDEVGHALAKKAITDGVAQAQKAQATNFQYIHAAVKQEGVDVLYCSETTSPDTTSGYGPSDPCAVNSPYYTHRRVDQWVETKVHRSCDSDGDCTEWTEYISHWKDRYTPWFDQIVRYWIVPDTKAKYLSEQIYHQRCLADDGSIVDCTHDEDGLINDSHKPVIYASVDWRAPQDTNSHIYTGGSSAPEVGQYNNHIPDAYQLPRDSARVGGSLVVENFVGPYFNWGLASESAEFTLYAGHYQDLINMTELPGPNGAVYDINDPYGKPMKLQTMLISSDGDLAVWFNPVFTIGVTVDPTLAASIQDTAMQFQGDFGPNPTKHGSARWFLVSDSVVQKLGGIINATAAVKSYLKDPNVWGLFALPKNLVIMMNSISADGTRITGRDMATGMPFGNVLVMQNVRLSINPGDSLPLTPENLIGSFSARYDQASNDVFTYQFSDFSMAGGAASILYEPDPTYKAPDTNSTACENADPNHKGFVLYSMCALQYLQSDIKINQNGADLIMSTVVKGAQDSVSETAAWVSLIVVILLIVGTAAVKSGMLNEFGYY